MRQMASLFDRLVIAPLQDVHKRSIARPVNPATTSVETSMFMRLPDLANIVFGACIAFSAVSVDVLSRELRLSEGGAPAAFVVTMYLLRIILGLTIWILYFRMIALAKGRARVTTEWFSTLAWAPLPFAIAFFAVFAGVPLFGAMPSEVGLYISAMSLQWIAFASLAAFHAFLALFGYAMLVFGDPDEGTRVEIRASVTFAGFASMSWALFSISVAISERMIQAPQPSIFGEITTVSIFAALTLGCFVLSVVRSAAIRRAFNKKMLTTMSGSGLVPSAVPDLSSADRVLPSQGV